LVAEQLVLRIMRAVEVPVVIGLLLEHLVGEPLPNHNFL